MRAGVRMTTAKARIFDLVKLSGEEGIPAAALAQTLNVSPETIKAHVWQINEMIADSGWIIKPTVPRYGYSLKKR